MSWLSPSPILGSRKRRSGDVRTISVLEDRSTGAQLWAGDIIMTAPALILFPAQGQAECDEYPEYLISR